MTVLKSDRHVACEFCKHCRFPRNSNDNWGCCKCAIMKYKTIDVSVTDGQTPEWCPIIKREPEK